ncbi:MAG: methylmalonyl-CoA mutase, partial [Oligoflexia bacterium]|nr:methylmalonyl-CoA mutase [Oligoflexia bacterium]
VARLYSPDDGRAMGLQGMINDLLAGCDFERRGPDFQPFLDRLCVSDDQAIAALITIAETHGAADPSLRAALHAAVQARISKPGIPVLGITGTGGAGKSSLVDELIRRFLVDFPEKHVAVLSIDPTRKRSGGALLGDRIRMNSASHPRCYMRSLATRQANLSMSGHVHEAIDICKAAGFDLVIVETSGIGQSDTEIIDHCDVSMYVMTAEYGAATQLEKIDMLDYADLIAINKFDKRGSQDALRDVRKQVLRNRGLFDRTPEDMPVYGTIASQFSDPGTNRFYRVVMDTLAEKTGADLHSSFTISGGLSKKKHVIPPSRTRYLAEISDVCQHYDQWVQEQADLARRLYQLHGTITQIRQSIGTSRVEVQQEGGLVHAVQVEQDEPAYLGDLVRMFNQTKARMAPQARQVLDDWPSLVARYNADAYRFTVRDRVIEQPLWRKSLSQQRIPKVVLPRYSDWGDTLSWALRENVPGFFPYTAGVFPLKRQGEDPARQFAGEGGPERTNRRFHYLTGDAKAKRLSTAFDSVTLYGEDPDSRPDIYGKVGNSGVSIANLDDAKKLYSGFNLCDKSTSVSMTINGPAPMLLGFFMNAAIDQQCERYIVEHGLQDRVETRKRALYDEHDLPRPSYAGDLPPGNDGLGLLLLGLTGDQVLDADTYATIKADTLARVRGTVQADILKEDQAQNTCIFSTEFALRMMGDIQQYFIDHGVRNFYSVSISGYHIAEAGANPITQLAFTLANGFTFVEYYLARGMSIDDFAPNLSFFFSNGLDPEYAVIGRVARRIWAKAIKQKYGGNARSQKLKYHIQTSGRSLHAQEIAFNDIRTTLQALTALNDNCNSLHTNAYDEAITTPTEESVRRALAIQLIINKEYGLSMNENPNQGSFITEYLTDLVEAAVLEEFRRISDRGGVLGAMERMYQRAKIQEESLLYETLKHTGQLPIVGVNTFLDPKGSPTIIPAEVIRAAQAEKQFAITSRDAQHQAFAAPAQAELQALKQAALEHHNIFERLLEACKVCTLGQISQALYQVGGQYRRNM